MNGIIGKKIGMTQLFNEDGKAVPVTVIKADPGVVVGTRTQEKDGYEAVQMGFFDTKEKHLTKPVLGQFAKAGVTPKRLIVEFDKEAEHEYKPGDELGLSVLEGAKKVKVTGTSKGHGFSGTIKRHGFHRGPMTHGSHNHRAPGSIGAASSPSRVFPGMKGAGQYGNKRCSIKNLEVVKLDLEENLLFVKGAVPGPTNGTVLVRK